jgi:Vitamin B12 dependent methionine synthase, activation domain
VSLPDGLQVLTDLPLAIDPDEVLRFQGYKRGRDVPGADVRALFDEALAEGRRLMTPRAVARWGRVTALGDDRLEVEGQPLAIPGIRERWGTVTHAAAVVCTIGPALEERVSALWEARELPQASMLDSVGSGAVESLAEYVNDVLCGQGLPDLRVTNRISPGYADWDVAEQPALFRLCATEAIGVRLNAACVMTPGKSISLLVGAGPQARVDHYFSQCARCWMRDCAYRRTPVRGTVVRSGPGAPARS